MRKVLFFIGMVTLFLAVSPQMTAQPMPHWFKKAITAREALSYAGELGLNKDSIDIRNFQYVMSDERDSWTEAKESILSKYDSCYKENRTIKVLKQDIYEGNYFSTYWCGLIYIYPPKSSEENFEELPADPQLDTMPPMKKPEEAPQYKPE